jgi:nitrogen fixation protein NifT
MAKVMLREQSGVIYFYVAKKDMEETIEKIEFESDDKWGGEVELSNGEIWYIEPNIKKLPKEANNDITMRSAAGFYKALNCYEILKKASTLSDTSRKLLKRITIRLQRSTTTAQNTSNQST